MRRKVISAILAVFLILGLLQPIPAEADFEVTYTLTGNQRKDILGVAVTQLGYVEGPHNWYQYGNDTKYGDWYGLPYNEWCAMFITWCARQADISGSILQDSCRANPKPDNFDLPCYSGTEYTPQPGDLFFKNDFSHVGLVYEVRGDTVITIEGNVNYEANPEEDGFTVAFLERKIEDLCFGVPDYKGCDPCPVTGEDHAYTRKHDQSHPHANYFECEDCGDLYYTGSKAHVTDCPTCMSCGCSTSYAGLYKVVGVNKKLNLREGHGTQYWERSVAEVNSIVEVLAGNGYWAHIMDAQKLYYASMAYLQRYVPAPGNLVSDAEVYVSGETAVFAWDPAKTATDYRITVWHQGDLLLQKDLGDCLSYALTDLEAGSYQVQVIAGYAGTVSEAVSCEFTVLNRYPVEYDGRGGEEVPQTQHKIQDRPLTLSTEVPVKDGFRFLGWTDDPEGNYAKYQPGDTWTANAGAVLYAVWQENSATVASLEILTPARNTVYLVGDRLDIRGLELLLCYSDGSARRITEGYTVAGFDSEAAGELTLTVSYEGVSVEYSVTVLDYLPGDVDKNRVVDKEDVMQLLWHVSFPEMFPISVPADFTGDGIVNGDDVMQLLWHISFPEMFPLM